ncbi:MAG TPA: hypothetical protein ENI64_10950 [Gammaproteobacteria bacterium]|nr:hypothetical protein [Gammaproteobacteria bacterium]
METIATFDTIIDANMALGRLKAEDIPAQLADEHLVQTDMLYSIAVGGIKLQVEPQNADRARQILATDYSDLLPSDQ